MTIAARSRFPVLLLLGIVSIGFILRGPIVAVAPITGRISGELSLSAAEAGLLTTLPVLCFALVTPFASVFVGRAGANLATTTAILGVGVGSIVRSAGGLEATIVGTVLMGAFITVGNVVLPVIIRRDIAPRHVGIVTGAYTSALNVSSMITTLATVPLADAFGWRGALLTWIGFVVVAAAVWSRAIGPRAAFRWGPVKPAADPPGGDADESASASLDDASLDDASLDDASLDDGGVARPLRAPRTWLSLSAVLLALTFGAQAFSYYGLTAWLPTILEEELGYSVSQAGTSSSIFQIAAVIGALGVPLLSYRLGVPRTFALVSVLWISCPLGLLLASDVWLVWGFLGGVAQGGGITIIFMLVVQLAQSGTHARHLSAMVQGAGYAVGATSPSLVGAVHDATGSWTVPIIVVLAATVVFTAAGIAASIRASDPRRRVAAPEY